MLVTLRFKYGLEGATVRNSRECEIGSSFSCTAWTAPGVLVP